MMSNFFKYKRYYLDLDSLDKETVSLIKNNNEKVEIPIKEFIKEVQHGFEFIENSKELIKLKDSRTFKISICENKWLLESLLLLAKNGDISQGSSYSFFLYDSSETIDDYLYYFFVTKDQKIVLSDFKFSIGRLKSYSPLTLSQYESNGANKLDYETYNAYREFYSNTQKGLLYSSRISRDVSGMEQWGFNRDIDLAYSHSNLKAIEHSLISLTKLVYVLLILTFLLGLNEGYKVINSLQS
jgi:hypothetical protein